MNVAVSHPVLPIESLSYEVKLTVSHDLAG